MISGPSIEQLKRRLADIPAEFREPVAIGNGDNILLSVVIGKLLQPLGVPSLPTESVLQPHSAEADKDGANRLQLIIIGAWLLGDPGLAGHTELIPAALEWLFVGLNPFVCIVPATKFVDDDNRREELVRLCLKALGMTPEGESAAFAHERLMKISPIERQRVAEERARQVREEIQRKAAQEAAAKGSRE